SGPVQVTSITTYTTGEDERPTPTTSTTTGLSGPTSVGTTDDSDAATASEPVTSGPVPDFGDGAGCDKIDVVYVLSQNVPYEFRDSVREGILHFNKRLVETFTPNIDLHLLVTDDMWEWSGDVCRQKCEDYGHCEFSGNPDFSCEAVEDAHGCEKITGAGHTFPIGVGAANVPCVDNKFIRYLTSDTPDLLGTLNCVTQKQPFDGVLAGWPHHPLMVSVTGDGPNGCNKGFLREDALLIMVYVTNTAEFADNEDTPAPEVWAQTLFEAKNGNSNAVGVIGLITDRSTVDPICQPPGNPDFPRKPVIFLRDMMPHRVMGSICASDTKPYFDQGIEMMLDLCEQYVPQ
ncbi:MAG: hypothetical protein ACPG4T_10655, partial [Nannocystaceae bacterium]